MTTMDLFDVGFAGGTDVETRYRCTPTTLLAGAQHQTQRAEGDRTRHSIWAKKPKSSGEFGHCHLHSAARVFSRTQGLHAPAHFTRAIA